MLGWYFERLGVERRSAVRKDMKQIQVYRMIGADFEPHPVVCVHPCPIADSALHAMRAFLSSDPQGERERGGGLSRESGDRGGPRGVGRIGEGGAGDNEA